MKAADVDKEAWRRIKPKAVLKVTLTVATAYGASLLRLLRTEFDILRRTERDERRSWRVQR